MQEIIYELGLERISDQEIIKSRFYFNLGNEINGDIIEFSK